MMMNLCSHPKNSGMQFLERSQFFVVSGNFCVTEVNQKAQNQNPNLGTMSDCGGFTHSSIRNSWLVLNGFLKAFVFPRKSLVLG